MSELKRDDFVAWETIPMKKLDAGKFGTSTFYPGCSINRAQDVIFKIEAVNVRDREGSHEMFERLLFFR